MLSVGCLKENNDSDFRVSLTPETSKKLIEKMCNDLLVNPQIEVFSIEENK